MDKDFARAEHRHLDPDNGAVDSVSELTWRFCKARHGKNNKNSKEAKKQCQEQHTVQRTQQEDE